MKVERFPAQEVYIAGAKVLSEHLEAGRNVAVLCEGIRFSMAHSCICLADGRSFQY